jgi:hypothetical protein
VLLVVVLLLGACWGAGAGGAALRVLEPECLEGEREREKENKPYARHSPIGVRGQGWPRGVESIKSHYAPLRPIEHR